MPCLKYMLEVVQMIRLDKTRDKDKQIKHGGVVSLCTLLMATLKIGKPCSGHTVIIV